MSEGSDRGRIADDLAALGVARGAVLMVHASFRALGQVGGGPDAVIDALLDALGAGGTLVMPTFREGLAIEGLAWSAPREIIDRARAELAPYDAATTPTDCGILAETFRRRSGVLRSAHPFCSVAACGPEARRIVEPHPPSWGQGPGSPFARMWERDAQHLLLGVGFDRLTLLHFAELRVQHGRRKTRLIPEEIGVLLAPDAGDDRGAHFPAVGEAVRTEGLAAEGPVAEAHAILVSARPVVAVAERVLAERLPPSGEDEED